MNTKPLYLIVFLPFLLVPLGPGIIDSISPVPAYVGSWVVEENIAYAFGESARVSSTVGDSIEFEVDTTGFTVFFLYTSGGGNFDLCVDGECTVISTDGLPAQGRVTLDGLPTGSKEIVIEVASGPIYFDAVYVYPYLSGGSSIVDFNLGGETQTGRYDFSITAGETAIVVLLVMLVVMQIAAWITSLLGDE